MTDLELKELVASLAVDQKETSTQDTRNLLDDFISTSREERQKTEERFRERDKELERSKKETDQALKSLSKEVKELSKQIGGLGNKFGSFTEGMAFPSIKKLLRGKFGLDSIALRFIHRKDDHVLEFDVFGYGNGDTNLAVIVEVKSHAREKHIEQMLKQLDKARRLLPELLANKKLYGILAAVDIPDAIAKQAIKKGLYLAQIHDENFVLKVPDDFEPRVF